jgi:hypothetical protein
MVRDLTDEQRSRRHIFNATLRAAATSPLYARRHTGPQKSRVQEAALTLRARKALKQTLRVALKSLFKIKDSKQTVSKLFSSNLPP